MFRFDYVELNWTYILMYKVCPPHICEWGGQNIRNTSQYNPVQFNTTANNNLNTKHIVELVPLRQCQSKLDIIICVKVEYMAVLSYYYVRFYRCA